MSRLEEDILKRNVADLEIALKQQTERADAAQAELRKLREQKPVAWMYVDSWGTHFTEENREVMESYGVEEVTELYAAPTPAPAVPDSDTVRCARRYLALREHGILLRQDAVVFDVTDLDAAADRLLERAE